VISGLASLSIQGIADLFRRSRVLGAPGYCGSLKQSQKWQFGDWSDEISDTQQSKIIAD
jgi:hypothetical protein